jgi:hypothetical protein
MRMLICGTSSGCHSELIKTWMGTSTPQSSFGTHSSELPNGSQASVTYVRMLKMCYLEHRHHKHEVPIISWKWVAGSGGRQCPPCILPSRNHHNQQAIPSPGESGGVIIRRLQDMEAVASGWRDGASDGIKYTG